jgi:excisionase family DNA binding protein
MSKKLRSDNPSSPAVVIPKRLYTIEEAAIYLGRTAWSVRELVWGGLLPSVKVGRRVHLDFDDLNSFIDRHKVRESLP